MTYAGSPLFPYTPHMGVLYTIIQMALLRLTVRVIVFNTQNGPAADAC
jgi:hypothetical protein